MRAIVLSGFGGLESLATVPSGSSLRPRAVHQRRQKPHSPQRKRSHPTVVYVGNGAICLTISL